MPATTRKKRPTRARTTRRPPARASRARGKARRRTGWAGPGRSKSSGQGAALRLPKLDERQRDVLALGLVAVGVFMGFVLYGGWDGGRAGHGLAVALGWSIGRARGLAPIALIVGGAAMLMAPVLPALRPLRTGGACVFAAVTLALAAGTLGVSAGTPHGAQWSTAFLSARGGAVGQIEYVVAHRLVQQVGVDILVVFLLVVGIVLLTGASLASAIRATGGGVMDTTRMLRTLAQTDTGKTTARAPAESAEDIRPFEPLLPPDPAPGEVIVRATHVEAPSIDGTSLGPVDPWAAEAEGEGEEAHNKGPDAGDEAEHAPIDDPDVMDDVEDDEAEHISGVAHAAAGGVGRVGPDQLTPQGRLRDAVTDDPDFEWHLPEASRLLTRSNAEQTRPDTAGQARTATSLVEALGHFGVQAKVIGTVAGPHITRYELRLAPGTKVAKVAQLKDDLAYALAATDIRILAPIPGKQAVGVEVPNAKRRIVRLGDVFQAPPADWSPLTVWLGKDVAGKAIGADLAKMPHLLVAGTTGAGKSGAINAMLCSVLLRATPHEVRLVLVDPKQVELNHYESIPHLLTPVITSPKMAANALQNLVREMEQRYGIMSMARTRSLIELNRARAARQEAPLPYILCVIDELADLMMVAPADVEDSIIRLAQKARAVGIHLVLATQSPRVDVITGMIKANVPSRIAFAVSSQTDSRVILDQNGAESLLGQGDMLFSPVGTSRLQRIQGAYIDEAQIAKLTDLWRKQGEPELREELLQEVEGTGGEGSEPDEFDPDEDPLLSDAIRLVAEMQTASTSMLQRRLRLGYTRAGRLIDMLERRGVISGYEGSKPRQVLVTEADLPRVLAALSERGGSAGAPAPEQIALPAPENA
jgi:S-DNA-T family DNA segregation ATPase FtsK/SpoIIIE